MTIHLLRGARRRAAFRPVWAAGLLAVVPAAAAQAAEAGRPVTFAKDVAPILQRSCESCHRAEGGAPMALVTYEDVRPWARAIKDKTSRPDNDPERMPPWFIEKDVGIQRFKNDISLSRDEVALLAAWVDAGAPRGDPADMPPPRAWPAGTAWTVGEPDLIVSSPVIDVRAEGSDWWGSLGPFPTGLTEDRYIKSVEVREIWPPGLREQVRSLPQRADLTSAVVHHASVTDVSPDPAAPAERRDNLVVYELGQNALVYPDAVGRVLEAGAQLVLELHTHSIGVAVPARLDIGFTFHPRGHKPRYEQLRFGFIGNPKDSLDIPAGEEVRFDHYYTLPEAAILSTFEPHMHASGVRMCVEAFLGGTTGKREMLNCAGYNHNWVKVYAYEDDAAPLLPKGTLLHLIGWYNNTEANPRVVDPRNWKGYGRRSIDDMFIFLPRLVFLTEEEFRTEVAAREAQQSAPAERVCTDRGQRIRCEPALPAAAGQ